MAPEKNIRPPWEEIFRSFGDGLLILDVNGMIIGMNPAAEVIAGASSDAVLGLSLKEAFPGNQTILEKMNQALREHAVVTLREMPWVGRGGEKATIDLVATPLSDDEGNLSGWIVVLRDITPVKKLEEEIRKTDRLAMMGTIAAGLAHEIKNPLGGIKGAAQLLSQDQMGEESRECLSIIIKEVDRVDRLVNQLLTFARPKTLTLEPLNVNELVDSIMTLQRKVLDDRQIQVIREYDPSLPLILGSVDELKQVFLNFIQNAIDAVTQAYPKGGGQIRLRSRMLTSFKIKGGEGKKPSRMIVMDIEDNGVGIPREDFDKIFTPFFTRKEKGYGLGLAIAQRVVAEHGGLIHLASEEGKGTSFQILLRSAL